MPSGEPVATALLQATAGVVFRGDELIPARGQTVLQAGDHVYVLRRAEDRSLVHLLFGEAQES